MYLDWLIVGGGIHGTFLSNYLLNRKGVERDKIAVLDNHREPLANWLQQTDAVAMKYLRSPVEHNLDLGSQALRKWAHDEKIPDTELYSKFDRPSLRSFNSHSRALIERNQLEELRVFGEAKIITRDKGKNQDRYLIKTEEREFLASNVIICTGQANKLAIPDWALDWTKTEKELRTSAEANQTRHDHCQVMHLFDKRYQQVSRDLKNKEIVIIGGGISGAQAALALAERQPGKVVLLHREPLQTYQFDADPCWLSTRCLGLLRQARSPLHRRRIVEGARHKGSFPQDIAYQLQTAVKEGKLRCVLGQVESLDGDTKMLDRGKLKLTDGTHLPCHLVVLATGFAESTGASDFVRNTMRALDLKETPCGIPHIDYYLRAAKGLFVSGPLAELELGPAARNIVGARIAAERICQIGRSKKPHPKEYNYFFMASRRIN